MPKFMLKKVAIAQGFRLAFPVEMGGMPYIPEEISANNSESLPPADIPEATTKPTTPEPNGKITDNQRKKIFAMCQEKGMSKQQAADLYHFALGDKEPTKAWASEFIKHFEEYFDNFLDSATEPETNLFGGEE